MAGSRLADTMPHRLYHDDPTIPPPGQRTGSGLDSIFPFLEKSLASKVQVPTHPDDVNPVPELDPPPGAPRAAARRPIPE